MDELRRVTTGNAQLDAILGGGYVENSINVVMGWPGTGKTILVESIVFANARGGRKALYLSTASEPLDKMLHYVQRFGFYDESVMLDSIVYEDLGEVLRAHGLGGAVERIIDLLKEHTPAFLVIDSFKALHPFAASPGEFRALLSELASALSALAVTSFLVGEYGTDDVVAYPEFAIADSILEIVIRKVGAKDVRYLRMTKQRGTAFLGGEHAFRIGDAGLVVYPRLTSPEVVPDYQATMERMPTGVEVLDEMLKSGLWSGSSTVVFGPPGSGKTLLGLHFVFRGIEMGQKGLIATMEENPVQLARVAAGFGWDLKGAIDAGMLDLIYASPVDVYIDQLVWEIDALATTSGVRRLMIDSLNDLQMASPDALRFRDYMYALVQKTSSLGISTIMTNEVRNLFSSSVLSEYGISHMSDNVMLLHYVREESRIKRAVSVIKTRGSEHDHAIREFRITPEGLHVGEPFSGTTHFGNSTD